MNQLSKEAKSFTEWLPEASKDILQELRLLNIYKSLGVDNLKDAQSKIEQLVAEKAGLISLEDAMGFAEWAQYECIRHEGDWILEKQLYTTAQLFQIYKQQKNGR